MNCSRVVILVFIAASCYVLCSSRAVNDYQSLTLASGASNRHQPNTYAAKFQPDSRQKRAQPDFSDYRERNELLEDAAAVAAAAAVGADTADGYFEQLSPSAYNQLVDYLWALMREPPKPRPRLGRRNSPETRQSANLGHEDRAKPSKVRALYPPRLGKRTETCN